MMNLNKVLIPALALAILVSVVGCSASEWISTNLTTDTLNSFFSSIVSAIASSLTGTSAS